MQKPVKKTPCGQPDSAHAGEFFLALPEQLEWQALTPSFRRALSIHRPELYEKTVTLEDYRKGLSQAFTDAAITGGTRGIQAIPEKPLSPEETVSNHVEALLLLETVANVWQDPGFRRLIDRCFPSTSPEFLLRDLLRSFVQNCAKPRNLDPW
jgi:hypothetical protein